MKNLTTTVILAAALAAGIVSFLYASSPDAATPGRTPPMSHLLELSPEQESTIGKADPNFRPEARSLAAKLDAEHNKLAELLEDAGAGREAVMAQVETMMLAHNALERRVAEHVMEVREHLSPQQRAKLMSLMAERVRVTRNRMNRCRWGWGRNCKNGKCPSGRCRRTGPHSRGEHGAGARCPHEGDQRPR